MNTKHKRMIERAYIEEKKFNGLCADIAKEAQKYVEKDISLMCEFHVGDGLVLTTDNDEVISVEYFFEEVANGNIPFNRYGLKLLSF